jgi:hypothetical protein
VSVVSCERGPGRVCGVARLPGLSSRIGLRRQLSGMFYLKHNEKTRFGYFANDRDCQGDLDVCDRLLMLSNYIILTLPEAQRDPTTTSRLYSAPPARLSRLGPRRDLHNALEAPLPDAAAVASASLAKRPSQKLSRQKSLKRYPCIVWT